MANFARQNTKRLQAYLCINLALLLLASVIAHSGQIGRLEVAIFRIVNGWPADLHVLFLIVTQAGSAWMLFGLTLLFLGIKRERLALRVFATGTLAFILSEVLKNVVGRLRPSLILESTVVRDHLVFDYGFPSGHTAVATAVGLVMLGVLPRKWHWLCWLWILLVAVSRVYLGVHAPLDIVGGFCLGVSVVCMSLLVRGKLAFVRKITGLKFSR